MKHLLYEHQNNITELKRDGAVAVTLEQSQHHEREGELSLEKRSLKVSFATWHLLNYRDSNMIASLQKKLIY